MQQFWQMPNGKIQRARRIPAHSAQDLLVDGPRAHGPERRGLNRLSPFGKPILEAKVGIEKISPWPHYPRNLRQETRKRRVAMRGFDIDHHLEGAFSKGQVL